MNFNIKDTDKKIRYNKLLEKNVVKNYMYTFLSNFNLSSGVWMLYLAYKGLSLFQIGIMEALFHLTSFIMEIPTGIVADLLGRRLSRIFGRVVAIVATVLMVLSENIYGFSISFIFSALSYNLESGAGEALLFDSMKEVGIDNRYMKIMGRNEVILQISSALALLIGGYLATIDYASVYKVLLVVGVVTLINSFSFIEPSIGKVQKQENMFATFWHQLRESIEVLKISKKLGFLIVVTESFSVFFTTSFFYVQNYLKMNGRSEYRIGIVLAIGAIVSALGAWLAYKLEKKLGYKKTLTMIIGVGVAFLWLLVSGTYSEVAIVGLIMVESIEYVVMSDYINRLIPSERRATILSMKSMLFSLFMIIIFPLVGYIGDLYSLKMSFIFIATLSSIVSVMIVIRVMRDE